jgi:hypothetical protein
MSSGSSRRIDLEIDYANGPRSIGGQIKVAKRNLDERIATILCVDDSGNEAIVLRDEHGVVRVFEHLRGGEVDLAEVAALIESGIDPIVMFRQLPFQVRHRTAIDLGIDPTAIGGAA